MPMPALAPVLRLEAEEDAEADVLVVEAVAERREAESEIVRPVGAAVEEVRPKSERSFCWYSTVMGCARQLLGGDDATSRMGCIPHIVMPSPYPTGGPVIWVLVVSV